jgi:hypothetical protein
VSAARRVLVVDGPLRGQVRECSGARFEYPYADPPGPSVPGQVYQQVAYKVVELVAFSGTVRIATSYEEPDEADLIDLILSPSAKAAR